jgi:F0F1-type ATP synthase membrane subunit b/b'
MEFTAARLQLHEGIVVDGGVISKDARLRLVHAREMIDHLMSKARESADELVAQAHQEAKRISDEMDRYREQVRVEAQQQARSLLLQINEEWRKIVASLEPTAVAVARMAIEKVCAGSTLAERVDAAVRSAVRELPENPVRLRVAPCNLSLENPSLGRGVDVVEDSQLDATCVRLEGAHGACEVNFEVAKLSVINYLALWSARATQLTPDDPAPTGSGLTIAPRTYSIAEAESAELEREA